MRHKQKLDASRQFLLKMAGYFYILKTSPSFSIIPLMLTLLLILITVVIISLVSLIGIFALGVKEAIFKKIIFYSISFAAGAMLSAAFLDLLPEALETGNNNLVFTCVLAGLIIFFMLEKFLYWYHCHGEVCEVHTFTYLNLVGDGVHNFIDGIIIATSYLISWPLGLATSLAILFHEIPQELGDYSILVYGGLDKKKALFYNYLCSLTAIAGALIGYFFNSQFAGISNYIVAVACGGFIYIACADLIPELHKENAPKTSLKQTFLLFLGIAVIWLVKLFFE